MNLDELRLIHPELALLAIVAIPIALLYLATFLARRRALARFAGPGARLSSVSGGRQARDSEGWNSGRSRGAREGTRGRR